MIHFLRGFSVFYTPLTYSVVECFIRFVLTIITIVLRNIQHESI